jgi:AraC-like DNA-binding protein
MNINILPALPFLTDLSRNQLSVEFRQSNPALRKYITGYNFYGLFGEGYQARELYMPAWIGFRFNWSSSPWWGAYKAHERQPLGPSVILGPSVKNMAIHTPPDGISLGLTITPIGSARFLNQAASDFAGKVVTMSEVWPDADALRADIEQMPDCNTVASYFDDLLMARMGQPSPDEPLIEALMGLLVENADAGVSEIANILGCSLSTLRRISLMHFGFPIKVMLRRARFMRSLAEIYRQDRGNWARYIDEAYHDQSHFIKDFQYFMGMTPSDFINTPSPMTALSMRARARTLGAPFVALHRTDS